MLQYLKHFVSAVNNLEKPLTRPEFQALTAKELVELFDNTDIGHYCYGVDDRQLSFDFAVAEGRIL